MFEFVLVQLSENESPLGDFSGVTVVSSEGDWQLLRLDEGVEAVAVMGFLEKQFPQVVCVGHSQCGRGLIGNLLTYLGLPLWPVTSGVFARLREEDEEEGGVKAVGG